MDAGNRVEAGRIGVRTVGGLRASIRLGLLILAVGVLPPGQRLLGQSLVTNTYSSSSEEFANPERGFYYMAVSHASSPSAVPAQLASWRINGKSSPGNTYTAKISLLLRLYYLDTFISTPISPAFLNSIQTDFDSIRAQGCKAIVRFAYNQDTTRPFAEPSKAQILEHIAQLKPVLLQNSDVIAVLQHGFIGAWGEGYYTDVFYTNHQATAEYWMARAEVIDALLDALPPERMIQVRVPQHKQKYVLGPTAAVGSPALSSTNVLDGSNAARIGFHNDCFLASDTDFGTFSDYDYGAGTSAQDIADLRQYMGLETRYAPMGGETCWVNPPADDCSSAGGNADTDMALFHYSYLHQSYNADVNDDWVAQGCIEDIKRQLGYRLELVSGVFRTEAQAGQAIPLTLEFQNVGYAAPFNPRGMELVLRHAVTEEPYYAELSRDTDLRRWLPGTNQVLNLELSLPSDLPDGDYDLLLNLPDPMPSLYDQTAYSIRLANADAFGDSGILGSVWEPATGYHNLHHRLTINATASNPLPTDEAIPVLGFSAIRETYTTWRMRNFPGNPGAGLEEGDAEPDGRINLVEYAVGSNPNVVDLGGYLDVSVQGSDFYLSLEKGPGTKDVVYAVESSPDLAPGNWGPEPVTILENSASLFRVRRDGTDSTGFLRLTLSLQADGI